MIYVSKPTQVEAFRWFGDARQEEDPEWIVSGIKLGLVTIHRICGELRMKISKDGLHPYLANWAQPGDWIIRDEDGLHKTMSNDAFVCLYDVSPNDRDQGARPGDAAEKPNTTKQEDQP
jgi:hypothetical protein